MFQLLNTFSNLKLELDFWKVTDVPNVNLAYAGSIPVRVTFSDDPGPKHVGLG